MLPGYCQDYTDKGQMPPPLPCSGVWGQWHPQRGSFHHSQTASIASATSTVTVMPVLSSESVSHVLHFTAGFDLRRPTHCWVSAVPSCDGRMMTSLLQKSSWANHCVNTFCAAHLRYLTHRLPGHPARVPIPGLLLCDSGQFPPLPRAPSPHLWMGMIS